MEHSINTLLDPVTNFGKVIVSTGYNDTTTSIVLNSGEGYKLPDTGLGSFNLVWFNNSTYADPADDPNVEIVRCISRVGDTLILMRAQEGTGVTPNVTGYTHNISGKIYKMILAPTKKTIDDIQSESASNVSTHAALSTGIHGVGASTVESITGSQAKVDTHAALSTSVHNFDSSGDAPAQTHGISRHTGTIGDHTANLSNVGTNTHAQIDTAITNSTSHIAASAVHGATGAVVGTTNTQSLTNKTITDATNNVMAKSLKSVTTTVDVSAAISPSSGQVLKATSSTSATWQSTIITKGGTIYNSAGIPNAALNLIIWYAPFSCTVTNVRGYRVGGTGATINARRNGSLNHLASAKSLTSADTWMDGGTVQNTAYAAGDKLEIMVVSTTGTVTQFGIQVDFTIP